MDRTQLFVGTKKALGLVRRLNAILGYLLSQLNSSFYISTFGHDRVITLRNLSVGLCHIDMCNLFHLR